MKSIKLLLAVISLVLLSSCSFAQKAFMTKDSSLVLNIKYGFTEIDYIYVDLDAIIIFNRNDTVKVSNIKFDVTSGKLTIIVSKDKIIALKEVFELKNIIEVYTKFHLIGDIDTYSNGYYVDFI